MFLDPNILSDDGTVALRGECYPAEPTGVPGPSLAADVGAVPSPLKYQTGGTIL